MRRSSSSLALVAAVSLAAWQASCQGVVGDPGALGDGILAGSGSAGGDDDGDDGSGGSAEVTGEIVAEPLHRLNGLEYDNTVRDLLGTTLTPSLGFPPDTVEGGFDNAADGLTLTPAQMDLYATAARQLAAATLQTAPRFSAHTGARQHAEASGQAGNAFDWGWSMPRFGGSLSLPSLENAEDEVVTFSILAGGDAVGMPTPEMGLVVDGAEVGRWVVTSAPTVPVVYTVQVPLAAGAHAVAITFPNGADQPADNVYNTLVVGWLEARSEATVTPAGRALVYECEPAAVADPVGCYHHIVTRFAERAWRRPLDGDEEAALIALWEQLRIAEGDDVAVELAVRAVLVSSKFLYRASFAGTPVDEDEETAPLDDHVLASRLSYFLWSSMPDQELFDAARDGALRETESLRRQVRRMLSDPRSSGLRRGFASQWLSTRRLAQTVPDPTLFPDFDAPLKAAMIEEAELFFEDFLANGQRIGDMMTPDFGYLNDRLATHYGLPLPGSDTMVRVELGEGDRRGILFQGAWLTATSASTRTSPVNRGRWILEQLLCNEVPPPPPDIPPFTDPAEGETVREVLAEHRENPACASCHDLLDPAGLGMEGFDAVGVVRTTENGQPIDTSGGIPTDIPFDGAAELADILAGDPRFVGCLTEKLFTYAMGRARVLEDDAFIDTIEGELAGGDGTLATLLELVVSSPAFRRRPLEGAQ